MKYSEILEANNELEKSLRGKEKYNITVLSNIVTYQLNEILEYCLRKENINANVQSGNYNNIPQDSNEFKDSNLMIIFWELSDIIDGLYYKANTMSDNEVDSLVLQIKSAIDFVLMNLRDTPLILFNKFSSLLFNHRNIKSNNIDKICKELNAHLGQIALPNVILIDIDKVIAETSIEKSVDFRYYYSSKVLYTVDFYRNYAEFVKPIILSANGKTKKVLIFDCDNTLWKGILGEDGFDGIEMSHTTDKGAIFQEVQYLALELNKRGGILGLCSKNNPQDVDKVITQHPDMVIRDKHIATKRVNWNDKVSNLKEIAKELNIGLDSLVFVEDSSFEVNYVREQLPQVTVLQVPEQLHQYREMLRDHMALFYVISESEEDAKRSEMYKAQKWRESEQSKFRNLEDYLESLDLQITLYVDNISFVPRISQLTQKTNQFNLTTKRCTEMDIKNYIESDSHKVFAFEAKDKYGSYGLTGLCIVKLDRKLSTAEVDTLLMSCRVIGRNIEYAFFNFIIDYLNKLGMKTVNAEYRKSSKNIQVENLYENLGFHLILRNEGVKNYALKLIDYKPQKSDYIGVIHEKKS